MTRRSPDPCSSGRSVAPGPGDSGARPLRGRGAAARARGRDGHTSRMRCSSSSAASSSSASSAVGASGSGSGPGWQREDGARLDREERDLDEPDDVHRDGEPGVRAVDEGGLLAVDQAQVGAHEAHVLGGGHLPQVAHEWLLVVHVDDGVADHPQQDRQADRRSGPVRRSGSSALMEGPVGWGQSVAARSSAADPPGPAAAPSGPTQPRSCSRVRAPATTAGV